MTTFTLNYKGGLNKPHTFFSKYKRESVS
jgi:hypothetical protein